MLVVLSPLAYDNPPGSVSTPLSDISVSNSLTHACGVITLLRIIVFLRLSRLFLGVVEPYHFRPYQLPS